jgi:hypothetical protein
MPGPGPIFRGPVRLWGARTFETPGGQNIWGFIVGTMRTICRTEENQRLYYSVYKKTHAIKYQAVMTPDGLMSHFPGPWEGRVGDYRMFMESNLQARLRAINAMPNGAD